MSPWPIHFIFPAGFILSFLAMGAMALLGQLVSVIGVLEKAWQADLDPPGLFSE